MGKYLQFFTSLFLYLFVSVNHPYSIKSNKINNSGESLFPPVMEDVGVSTPPFTDKLVDHHRLTCRSSQTNLAHTTIRNTILMQLV